jgi:ribonuclease D
VGSAKDTAPAELITRLPDLEALTRRLAREPAFAVDTEFERERSYWPKLQLIQVAAPGEVAVIDPLAVERLDPLFELIGDPAIQKVTHAGRQDAEIFATAMGRPPANIYDTQIAAALVGLGGQIGYANLVQRILHTKLKKTERVTDWGRRPLSPAQLEYAAADVLYLLAIKEHLDGEVNDLGRAEWLAEEQAFYSDPAFYERDPDTLWMRVSGWRTLDSRGWALLRELARWREETAMRRDIPRNRVVGDDVLVEIVLRNPDSVSDLAPLRRLHPREREKSGQAILDAVARGRAVPKGELPSVPRSAPEDAESSLVADLMSVVMKRRASENRIAPSYLGTQKDLSSVVAWLGGPRNGNPPPLLIGWRKRLVGTELIALYDGRASVHVDAGKRVRVRGEE